MNEQNLKYIANLKVQDVPWSRLTTAYGRASEFPEIFKKLARAIETCDSARALDGEQNLKSEPDAGRNLKSGLGYGQNSTDAAQRKIASLNLKRRIARRRNLKRAERRSLKRVRRSAVRRNLRVRITRR